MSRADQADSPVGRLLDLARRGRLYPATILHGGSADQRQRAAVEVARALLCEREAAADRPCGHCRNCARIAAPGGEANPFHPDFAWLARDLKTATSAEATRDFLRAAHSAPYEARGQVFVIGEADSLSPEAGDALLKLIEEPGLGSPRHYFLLAPSRLDLPETLRSRSLAVFLGSPVEIDPEKRRQLTESVIEGLTAWQQERSGLRLLDLARRLGQPEDFDDPRAEAPWIAAARVLRDVAIEPPPPLTALRPALLALADALLAAPPWRLRGIAAGRILEGLLARHLATAGTHKGDRQKGHTN
jgi:hypothetical protein